MQLPKYLDNNLIQLLENILGYPKLENEIKFFYQNSGIYSSLTPIEIEKELPLKRKDRLLHLLSKNSISSSKLILFRVLNGVILIDIKKKQITKIISEILEPNFLKNELQACKLLPNNTPKIYEYGVYKKYHYIIFKYYSKTGWLEIKDWSQMLDIISPIYFKFINQNQSLAKLFTVDKYLNNLLKQRNNITLNKKFMVKEFKSNTKLLTQCLKKYQIKNNQVLQFFCHGDITPNNVIKLPNQTILFDWANGGKQIMYYDLMIQAFYEPNNQVWKKFNQLNFLELGDNYFHGWAQNYSKMIKKIFNLDLSSDLIKMSIIIALSEMDLKNFLRYQTTDWLGDGLIISNHVKTIYQNILES